MVNNKLFILVGLIAWATVSLANNGEPSSSEIIDEASRLAADEEIAEITGRYQQQKGGRLSPIMVLPLEQEDKISEQEDKMRVLLQDYPILQSYLDTYGLTEYAITQANFGEIRQYVLNAYAEANSILPYMTASWSRETFKNAQDVLRAEENELLGKLVDLF